MLACPTSSLLPANSNSPMCRLIWFVEKQRVNPTCVDNETHFLAVRFPFGKMIIKYGCSNINFFVCAGHLYHHQRRVCRQARKQGEDGFRRRRTRPEADVAHSSGAALGQAVGGILSVMPDQGHEGIRQDHVSGQSEDVLLFLFFSGHTGEGEEGRLCGAERID